MKSAAHVPGRTSRFAPAGTSRFVLCKAPRPQVRNWHGEFEPVCDLDTRPGQSDSADSGLEAGFESEKPLPLSRRMALAAPGGGGLSPGSAPAEDAGIWAICTRLVPIHVGAKSMCCHHLIGDRSDKRDQPDEREKGQTCSIGLDRPFGYSAERGFI